MLYLPFRVGGKQMITFLLSSSICAGTIFFLHRDMPLECFWSVYHLQYVICIFSVLSVSSEPSVCYLYLQSLQYVICIFRAFSMLSVSSEPSVCYLYLQSLQYVICIFRAFSMLSLWISRCSDSLASKIRPPRRSRTDHHHYVCFAIVWDFPFAIVRIGGLKMGELSCRVFICTISILSAWGTTRSHNKDMIYISCIISMRNNKDMM